MKTPNSILGFLVMGLFWSNSFHTVLAAAPQAAFKSLFNGKDLNDSGRAVVSHNINDVGKFKVAALRNVAVTSPYMHNGMFQSLKEVIEFYNDPSKVVPDAVNRDTLLNKPLGLSMEEKKDLEAFLQSLTDKQFVKTE